MVRQMARSGVRTTLARVAPRIARSRVRKRRRSIIPRPRKRSAPTGRSRRPSRRDHRFAVVLVRCAVRARRGEALTSRRLTRRSTFRVSVSSRARTINRRRRTAAIIARRSGFFFAVRFAGPARAFFMRRSRLSPAGRFFDFPRFRFKTTLTLRPCHVTSP